MKVYGYTEEKVTIEVDLSVDTIVFAGIDPWRLDLEDPAPIVQDVDGTKLYFRKLRDVAFAYRQGANRLIIAVHDGISPACFIGETGEMTNHTATLNGIRESGQSFETHWRIYLEMMETRSNYDWSLYGMERALKERKDLHYPAQPADKIAMQGTTITLDTSGFERKREKRELVNKVMHSPTFVGEMMTEIEIPASLNADVNWVLSTFERFRPVVFGDSVRARLRDRGALKVHILIEEPLYQDFVHALLLQEHNVRRGMRSLFNDPYGRPADLTVYETSEEIEFDFGTSPSFVASVNRSKVVDVFRNNGHQFSPDCVYATKPNTICGARIAIFDLGAKKARPLYAIDVENLDGEGNELRMWGRHTLQEQGFEIMKPYKSSWYPPRPLIDRAG